jgi:hypothetical protein
MEDYVNKSALFIMYLYKLESYFSDVLCYHPIQQEIKYIVVKYL